MWSDHCMRINRLLNPVHIRVMSRRRPSYLSNEYNWYLINGNIYYLVHILSQIHGISHSFTA